jgi:hypothetical protein
MAITLTITDSEDGTGIATIAGSTGTNNLYKATWTGAMGTAISWTLVGTRSGDGTIALSGAGLFIWRLDNQGSLAAILYQAITDADADGIVQQLLDYVAATVQSLNLTGISSVNVTKRWTPRALRQAEALSLPKVLVCPWDRFSFPGILTGKDDIGIAILVVFVAAQNQDNDANLNRNNVWRWRTLSAFRYQAPAGISAEFGCYNCIPEDAGVLESSWFDKNLYVSALSFRFITRTPRGLT